MTIKSLLFSPPTITVKSGDTVVWTNEDPARHTVTSGVKGTRGIPGAPGTRDKPDGLFDAVVEPGASVMVTLDEPGRYTYFCRIHAGMTGTVIVR